MSKLPESQRDTAGWMLAAAVGACLWAIFSHDNDIVLPSQPAILLIVIVAGLCVMQLKDMK